MVPSNLDDTVSAGATSSGYPSGRTYPSTSPAPVLQTGAKGGPASSAPLDTFVAFGKPPLTETVQTLGGGVVTTQPAAAPAPAPSCKGNCGGGAPPAMAQGGTIVTEGAGMLGGDLTDTDSGFPWGLLIAAVGLGLAIGHSNKP
jgi:hypothetical protein